MARTQLASNGRIVIPAELRRMYHMNPGDEFEFVPTENGIHLVPKAGVVAFVQQLTSRYAGDRSLADELIAERKAEDS